ncbi:MAG: thioredoxin domain-containing protein [Candidatus Micrarchaeota archaeon]|nr:thioredoxin domain-containing protein [Candidatus Micrarchaeota archaeon]
MGKYFSFLAVAALFAAILVVGCTQAPINEGMTKDGRAYRGAADAKLTIYEYSDFECPFCGKAQPTVTQVMEAYGQSVKLEFRHYPLPIHSRAVPAAVASICAEKQGKFWGMHDLLYANQGALDDASLSKYAEKIGLEMAEYSKCVAGNEAVALIDRDIASGSAAGVQATPTFVIGNSMVLGAQPFDKFRQIIDAELAVENAKS